MSRAYPSVASSPLVEQQRKQEPIDCIAWTVSATALAVHRCSEQCKAIQSHLQAIRLLKSARMPTQAFVISRASSHLPRGHAIRRYCGRADLSVFLDLEEPLYLRPVMNSFDAVVFSFMELNCHLCSTRACVGLQTAVVSLLPNLAPSRRNGTALTPSVKQGFWLACESKSRIDPRRFRFDLSCPRAL